MQSSTTWLVWAAAMMMNQHLVEAAMIPLPVISLLSPTQWMISIHVMAARGAAASTAGQIMWVWLWAFMTTDKNGLPNNTIELVPVRSYQIRQPKLHSTWTKFSKTDLIWESQIMATYSGSGPKDYVIVARDQETTGSLFPSLWSLREFSNVWPLVHKKLEPLFSVTLDIIPHGFAMYSHKFSFLFRLWSVTVV